MSRDMGPNEMYLVNVKVINVKTNASDEMTLSLNSILPVDRFSPFEDLNNGYDGPQPWGKSDQQLLSRHRRVCKPIVFV